MTATEGTYTANQVEYIVRAQLEAMVAPAAQYEASTATNPTINPPEQYANDLAASNVHNIFSKLLAAQGNHTNNYDRNRNNRNNSNNHNGPNNCTDANNHKALPTIQGYDEVGAPVSYCYTHGVTKKLRHSSATCSRKYKENKDTATLANKMGG